MDFLDPKKQRAHMVRLIVGYILIGAAILLATVILLYQAYGFGLGKHGQVIQNGLVFVSSQPQGSQVYVDNKLYTSTTNTRLQLPEGSYDIQVSRAGYDSWQRRIDVVGGSVTRYDYPLLIPQQLVQSPIRTYAAPPAFATQSPDRRWVLVQQPSSVLGFDVYDLSDWKKISNNATSFTLPASLITGTNTPNQSWKLVEWSNDNVHLILQHIYDGGSEYILVDHQQPDKSVNLTRTLNLGPGQIISLHDKKFDKYYVFDPAARTLISTTLTDPRPAQVLSGVLAFKSYGSDKILYATEEGATPGKVMTMLKDGDVTYKIQDIGPGGPFLMDLAQYSGDWYVAVGASSDNKVYVYKDPQNARQQNNTKDLVPVQILRVTAPNYLEFSSNTQFIMIENATSFAVYDAEMAQGYTYTAAAPLDPPQTHATWMDGDRITYVSSGKVVIFDYDNTNFHALSAADPNYQPFFDRDYRDFYTLAPSVKAPGQSKFTQTSLLIPKDQ